MPTEDGDIVLYSIVQIKCLLGKCCFLSFGEDLDLCNQSLVCEL